MRETVKKITATILAVLLIFTCMPNYVEEVKADSGVIKEVHFNSDQQWGFAQVGDTIFDFSYGGSENFYINGFATEADDNYLYKENTFENKPEEGAASGETYYAKLAIVPKGAYSLDPDVEIYLGDLKLGPSHPCYVSEPEPYEDEDGIFITLKCQCIPDELLLPMLHFPALNPSLTPNDYMSLAEDGEAEIWWTIPRGAGKDDDVFAESKITSLEFYNDEKCTEGEKIDPSSYLGYNNYYVKAGFKITEISEETDFEVYTPIYPNYENQNFGKMLYICNSRYDLEQKIPSLMMSSNGLSVVTTSAYPIVTWDFSTDNAYVVFFVDGNFTRVNSVQCSNATEHELDITLYGTNLPSKFDVALFNEDPIDAIAYRQFTSGNFAVNDTNTELTFHLEVNKELGEYVHDIKPNETFQMYLEGEYSDENSIKNEVTISKDITPIVQRSTKKKYTVKNLNDSALKISGSSTKGSTRTIIPKEGRKVKSVNVTDSKGNNIDVTKNSDGTYSFIQPASNITVEVTYVNREITLNIGSTKASVDGEQSSLDASPVIRNDRTMLPIRFVAENLGAKVDWDETSPNTVLITKDGIKIEITLGSDIAKVNGKEYKLDSVAFAENDRTYLPVRFVSENLNAIVEWNEAKPMEVRIYER